jgi:hypothetical protein
MKVAFSQFWPGFEGRNSFFYRLLEANGISSIEVVGQSRKADLEFVSVFPKRLDILTRKAKGIIHRSALGGSEQALSNTTDELPERIGKTRVWFTGENIRVPHGQDFDYSLSFDQDSYGLTNIYLPLWHTHLDWFGKPEFNHRVGRNVVSSELLSPRALIHPKQKFACAFIGNRHPMRSRIIEELSKFGVVDVFGSSVGRPVKYKADIAKDYKYMICFENDFYPGYVTEKLLDAYLSGTVPFYWGDLGSDTTVNRQSFLNLSNFSSIAESVDHLLAIDEDQYTAIYSQPFLASLPSIETFVDLIKSV